MPTRSVPSAQLRRRAFAPRLLALVAIAGLGACDAQVTAGPELPISPASSSAASGALKGSALLVGNVSFGPSDGVLRYDATGAFLDAMVPEGTAGVTVPCCLRFGPDEHLYVSSPFSAEVFRFNGLTGQYIDTFIPAGSGGLVIPLGLVFHEGHLYVGDLGAQAILRYDADTGAFVDAFVPPGSAGLPPGDPQHFAFGPDGNLYVAAVEAGRVLRFDGSNGAFLGEFAPAIADVPDPDGLTFGPDGRLYVGSHQLSAIFRYDIATGVGEEFISPGSGGLANPVGFTFGPDGNLYTTSLGTSEILAYDGSTGAPLGAFVSAGAGGLSGPRTLQFKATITLCHRPPGNPARARTLTIAYLSGLDHAAHGDEVGPCA